MLLYVYYVTTAYSFHFLQFNSCLLHYIIRLRLPWHWAVPCALSLFSHVCQFLDRVPTDFTESATLSFESVRIKLSFLFP